MTNFVAVPVVRNVLGWTCTCFEAREVMCHTTLVH